MYTTSLSVSRHIKELIGDTTSKFYWYNPIKSNWQLRTDRYNLGDDWENNMIVPCFTLDELPEVLKKVGEKLDHWEKDEINFLADGPIEHEGIPIYGTWYDHYIQCCKRFATGGDVDQYLEEILKYLQYD